MGLGYYEAWVALFVGLELIVLFLRLDFITEVCADLLGLLAFL